MSERNVFQNMSERRKSVLSWSLGGLMLTGILSLNFCENVREGFHESKLFHGVTGQVEGRRVLGSFPNSHNSLTWLKVEQCPQDVAAARNGNPNQRSYDPAVKTIAAGCVVDEVLVNPSAYHRYKDGDPIIFDGDPTEPLRK